MQFPCSGVNNSPKRSSSAYTDPSGAAVVSLTLNREILRELIAEILREVVPQLDWPAGRLTLTESEAAAACGVARHVLRDLRLSGQIQTRKLGRRVVYSRADLLAALEASAPLSGQGA